MGVDLFAALGLLLIVLVVALKLRQEPLTNEEENPTDEEEYMLMEDEQDAQDLFDLMYLDEEEENL